MAGACFRAIGAIALTRTRLSGADTAVRCWMDEMSQPDDSPELTSPEAASANRARNRTNATAEPRRGRTWVNGLGEESVATRGPECADGARGHSASTGGRSLGQLRLTGRGFHHSQGGPFPRNR